MKKRLSLELSLFVALIPMIAMAADPVSEWNATATNAIVAAAKAPPQQGRIYAMTHGAIHDALNCISPRFVTYAAQCEPQPGASVEAAIATAARNILVAELPAQQPAIDAAYLVSMSAISDGPAKSSGIDVGREAAAAMILKRVGDGSSAVAPYVPGSGPGVWQPTPPAFAPASIPWWTGVTPFALKTASQFRAEAPPALTSDEYTADFNEVKMIGNAGITQRTAEQSEIARFHFESSALVWNRVSRGFALQFALDPWDSARLFALLNFAVSDAFLAGWDAKFHYNFWRPVTAIRAADSDGNPETLADPAWNAFLVTPAHPDYPSTHSLASGAAAEVIEQFFGTEDLPFSAMSGSLPGVTRSFASPSSMAIEVGSSRVYAGIHFRTACDTGRRMGRQIGHFTAAHLLRRSREKPHAARGFEENRGQMESSLKFKATDGAQTVLLTPDAIILSSRAHQPLTMRLRGARSQAQLTGRGQLATRSNYIRGSDPRRWLTGIPHFAEVRYRGAYPGIDMIAFLNENGVRYDFTVAPGADPSLIRLSFEGCIGVTVARSGELRIATGSTAVRQSAPIAYQDVNGRRVSVAARYARSGNDITFALGHYDHSIPLVIDPTLHLAFGTYLGGMATDVANGVAVDAEGNAYVIGRTESDNFPTGDPMQPVRRGGRDMFVAKIDAEGTGLIYSTYIGGAADENPLEIVVDNEGNAFITGVTSSLDFPVVNAFQPVYGGGQQDAFVLKLDSAGANLLYASYLGGTGLNQSRGIAIDFVGNAYLTGNSASDGFPLVNPIQSYGGGVSDAFVTKVSSDGSQLIYSTFLGGSALESGRGIRVDPAGAAYVVGETRSTNLPVTPGAFQTTYGGGLDDLFVAKLDPQGASRVFVTYVGGSGTDQGQATIGSSSSIHGRIIDVDGSGNVYITGDTNSLNFPLKNAFQPAYGGGVQDAFVASLSANGTDLRYSSYLGGSSFDTLRSIAVDESGRATVAGATSSVDFPAIEAVQPVYGGGPFDAVVAGVDAEGGALQFSSYLGGSGIDAGWDLAVTKNGRHVYVVGQTDSPDFLLNQPLQPINGGGFDAFVCKLNAKRPKEK